MTRPFCVVRRRTFLCVTLLVLVLAIALAFVRAQDDAAAAAAAGAADAVQQQQQEQQEEYAAPVTTAEEVAPVSEEEKPQAMMEEAQPSAEAPENVANPNAEAEAAALRQQQQAAAEEAERQRLAAAEEERQRLEAEERQRREAEERQRREAEERQRREAEERQRREAEERQRREAEERQRREAEERQRREAEERQRREAEERQRREAEEAAASRAAEEKAQREIDSVDTIRDAAKELPEGCAKAVEKYLFRVHEERRQPASAVSEARATLNEARVSAPKKVVSLERKLASAQDALLRYDVQTLRAYGGNVPKTCISEGQAWYDRQPAVESASTYVQAYTHFYRLMAAHLYTMYRTAEGLVHYLMNAYTPAVASFTTTSSEYQSKAWALYEKLFPAKGSRPEMPTAELAKQVATMVSYAAVPLGLGVAAGVVAVVALPPVAAGVLVYEFLYKIWAELFVFYYIYGMKLPEGLVTAAKTTVENVKAGEWGTLGSRSADAFFDLVIDSDKIFYNGILAVFLMVHIVAIAAILVCVWCRCCVPGMRRRKAKASPLRGNNKNSKSKGVKEKTTAEKKKN
ncbi:putative mitochondrial hypothetical protein [Leptomonas pyrrhocoris]|uniref:Uncharacterized protein n=1 Tax=Leptomonas pyrrhocoris TaxID=157538 RepID=A0A0M9G7K4_LEPPY|nr:putative mitochondrial hypothetical protein [Leptomonas pyrrhocoris]KPA84009.1 putative mitochondrial hypothetical protein [Leptomonas pyrrhocoris]|eukprot:XP_015662448.1 putative mitochondrial hypothetical protein [Leptomonas pyrrhocoris]